MDLASQAITLLSLCCVCIQHESLCDDGSADHFSDLAAKQKSPLVPNPSDLAAYGNFEKAASLETANFDQHAATIAYELVFAKM